MKTRGSLGAVRRKRQEVQAGGVFVQEKLSIRLFGVFEARFGGEALAGLHLREGERLLAFLTLHHGVPHTYRALAQLFWPSEAQQNEDYEGGSYPRTRQAIHSLRRALGEQAGRLGSPGKGVVCFDLADADVDLMEFERLVQREDAESMRRALELHRAPLLNTWNEAWIKESRMRCLRSCARLQSRLPAESSAPHSAAASIISTSPTPSTNVAPSSSSAPPAASVSAVPTSSVQESAQLEAVGGAVPLNSAFYIERETDGEFTRAVARQDSIVLVKGARQMGKTSLLARGLQTARKSGAGLLLTDFQSLSEADLVSAETLYRALAQEMADQLDLDTLPEEVWNAKRSAARNLERYLCDVVLKSVPASLVWGLDEVDRLFGYPCANEVFGLFRSWHNRRALDPDGPWSRLTLAIAYATEAHLFITDQNQSPFNVGTRLALSDFTREQMAELNRRHGTPLRTEAELEEFYALVGGHPYLTRCGLAALAEKTVTLSALQTLALQEAGPFGDHLLRLRLALQKSPELMQAMRDLLRHAPTGVLEHFYRLRSAGLVTGDGRNEARPRCQLYALYLSRHLTPANS